MGRSSRQGGPRTRDPERCTLRNPERLETPGVNAGTQIPEAGDPDPGRLGSQMSDIEEREYENS